MALEMKMKFVGDHEEAVSELLSIWGACVIPGTLGNHSVAVLPQLPIATFQLPNPPYL